ncbi:hypothetical protein ACI780_08470 [Geodermatophilus sp. SYSU D00814]
MGRHAAADDAGTDPIVAAALARHGTAPGTRHASASDVATDGGGDEGTESGLGWPGDTTTGGGLGWPGSLDEARETARMDAVPSVPGAPDGAPAVEDAAPGEDPGQRTRRGWRRMFGGTAA